MESCGYISSDLALADAVLYAIAPLFPRSPQDRQVTREGTHLGLALHSQTPCFGMGVVFMAASCYSRMGGGFRNPDDCKQQAFYSRV